MTLSPANTKIPPSALSRWDARWKWLACGVLVLAVAVLQYWFTAVIAFAFTSLLCVIAKIPFSIFLNRLGLLALSFIPLLMVFPLTASSWTSGLVLAATMMVKGLAIGLVALLLTRTATPAHNFAALARLGLPSVFVSFLQLQLRYIQVLTSEWKRIRTAMKTRGFTPKVNWHTYRTLGHGLGAMLVRGADRGERVSAAMLARGYTGKQLLAPATFQRRWVDGVYFLAIVLLAVGLVVWERMVMKP